MRILALERESNTPSEVFSRHLEAEARRIWELYQAGSLRVISFRRDRPLAVLELECSDAAEAEQLLATLPLVEQDLIEFELIPLRPYPGLARLFCASDPGERKEPS